MAAYRSRLRIEASNRRAGIECAPTGERRSPSLVETGLRAGRADAVEAVRSAFGQVLRLPQCLRSTDETLAVMNALALHVSLTSVQLDSLCMTRPAVIEAVARVLRESRTLRVLDIGTTRRLSTGDFKSVFEALADNTTLRSFSIAGHHWSAGLDALTQCVERNMVLTSLDLSRCALSGVAVTQLMEALEVNQTLTAVSITDRGAAAALLPQLTRILGRNRLCQIEREVPSAWWSLHALLQRAGHSVPFELVSEMICAISGLPDAPEVLRSLAQAIDSSTVPARLPHLLSKAPANGSEHALESAALRV